MAKMQSVAERNSQSTAVDAPADPKKVWYPTLHLSNPPNELMDKEIGKLCRVEMVIKIVSKAINEFGDKKNKNMGLEIHEVGLIGDAGKLNKKEYLEKTPAEREEYDNAQIYK